MFYEAKDVLTVVREFVSPNMPECPPDMVKGLLAIADEATFIGDFPLTWGDEEQKLTPVEMEDAMPEGFPLQMQGAFRIVNVQWLRIDANYMSFSHTAPTAEALANALLADLGYTRYATGVEGVAGISPIFVRQEIHAHDGDPDPNHTHLCVNAVMYMLAIR